MIGRTISRYRIVAELGHGGMGVVYDLVRDDVCLREVSRRAEPSVELSEETQVEIDLLIARTVKQAGG